MTPTSTGLAVQTSADGCLPPHAAAPLKPLIGKRRFDRLVRALSVVYGIEAYVVLRDIWGARDKEIEGIARWIADALVDTALREAANGEVREGRRGKRA